MITLKYLQSFFANDFYSERWTEKKVNKLCEEILMDEFEKDVPEELRDAVKEYAIAMPGQNAGNKYDLVNKLLE